MNIQSKRNTRKLMRYYVARELGLPVKRIKEIEEKKRSFNGEDLEKFIQIVDVDYKEHKMRQDVESLNAKKWLESVNVEELLKSFKVNRAQVAKDLDIAYENLVGILGKFNFSKERVLMVYDYFHNEHNRRHTPTISSRYEGTDPENNKYQPITTCKNKYDLFEILSVLGFRRKKELEVLCGRSTGTMTNWLKGAKIRDRDILTINTALNNKGRDISEFEISKMKKEEEIELPLEKQAPEIFNTEAVQEDIQEVIMSDIKEDIQEEKIESVIKEEVITSLPEEETEVVLSKEDYLTIKNTLYELQKENSFLRKTIESFNKLVN